jgi:hypothetical protein
VNFLAGRSRIACHIIAPIHQLLADSDHVCFQLFCHRGVKPGNMNKKVNTERKKTEQKQLVVL